MFWSYCAYILFMIGVALGLTRHAAEPALWFLSMGWVLQMTVILLRALGAKRVRFPERAAWQKAVLGLALAAVLVLVFTALKLSLSCSRSCSLRQGFYGLCLCCERECLDCD